MRSTRHGVNRVDDFAWLRAANWQEVMRDPGKLDPAIRAYLEAENRYADRVLACWKAEHELVTRIKVETRSAVVRIMCAKPPAARSAAPAHKIRSCVMARLDDKISAPATATKREAIAGSPRDALLTFNTFRAGDSNALAHVAAKQVVASLCGEAALFNQLYIHGCVGMGKTHLL